MIIFKILIKFALLPVIILLYPLKRFSKYQIAEIDTLRIGHLSVNFEPFIRENLDNSKKYFIIFNKKICNKYLFELYSKIIQQSKNSYFVNSQIFYKILKKLNVLYFSLFKKNFLFKISAHEDDFEPDWKKYDYFYNQEKILHLPKLDVEKGYSILEKFGLKRKDKWICIFNRDAGYLKKQFPDKDFSYHDYRDFSINDLKSSAEYFSNRGYYVFRVGKNPREKMSFSSNKIIDYSFSNIQSDFMDIFLLAECEFFFGGTSGISSVPLILRKPLFLINCIPIEGLFAYKRRQSCIFKRLKYKSTGKILSIREMVKHKLVSGRDIQEFDNKNGFFYTNHLKRNKIEFLNNTKKEILDLAVEAVDRVNKNFNTDKIYEEKLNLFINELKKNKYLRAMKIDNKIGKTFLENTLIK